MNRIIFLFFVVLFQLATPVYAALVNYSEAIDGDLSGPGSFPTVFEIDTVGRNIWSGSFFVTATYGDPFDTIVADRDFFNFTLAPGLQIDGFSYNISDVTFTGTPFDFIKIRGNLGPWSHFVKIDLLTLETTWVYGDYPWTPEGMQLGESSWDSLTCSSGTSSVSLNWQIAMDVSNPVPEPTTLTLLGLGLASISYTIRRKKTPGH